MAFELDDLQAHHSELLRLLTQTLPDMLWIKDRQGRYLYANKALCDGLLMAEDTEEPLGKDDMFFARREREKHKDNPSWHTFGESCSNSDHEVIRQNKPLRFEEYGNVKGEYLHLEVFKAPFHDKEGNILGTVGAGRDITELKKAQQSLEESFKELDRQKAILYHQAHHDELTGLPNRRLLWETLEAITDASKGEPKKFAVLFIDLDHFKNINDSMGHSVGDEFLIDFAQRLKRFKNEKDFLARMSGDEFCIVMEMEEGSQGKEHLLQSISGIMETTQEPFQIQEHSFYMNMSIGVSVYPEDGETIDLLLQRADSALYRAKETGRNRYCFYGDSVSNRIFERMVLETALRDAIREGQITAYFQPQIDAKTDRIAGIEALVRWQHPEKGLLTPDLFISVAEESGMIIELDRLVMRYAVEQFSTWKAQGYELGRLSLNLSVHQIEEAGFIEFIKTLLDAYPNVQEAIELEIMENAIMGNPERSIVILQQLRDMGIYLAIDDFGTGYSSLAYLKKFPINTLKIDKSFVDDLPDDTEDVAISKTIIDLANNLNMRVVAEGVETREQNDFLLANGCHYMQGHYYSHPLSAEAIEAFFREHA